MYQTSQSSNRTSLFGLRGLRDAIVPTQQPPLPGNTIIDVKAATGSAPWPWYVRALLLASGAASTYHGYKRNNSIGWALAWGAAGTIFPIITPTVALAQGFGKRKS